MTRTIDRTTACGGVSTHLPRLAAALLLALGLGACAGGKSFQEFQRTTPAPNPAFGRIYFYRPDSTASLLRPDVTLDSRKVGTIRARAFFYVDRPPGEYAVENSAGRKGKVNVTLRGGQSRFVRFTVIPQMGFSPYVTGEFVDPESARAEIGNCAYDAQGSESVALETPRAPAKIPAATGGAEPKQAPAGTRPEVANPGLKAPPPPAKAPAVPGAALPPPPPLD